jgi:hypothetical protein
MNVEEESSEIVIMEAAAEEIKDEDHDSEDEEAIRLYT